MADHLVVTIGGDYGGVLKLRAVGGLEFPVGDVLEMAYCSVVRMGRELPVATTVISWDVELIELVMLSLGDGLKMAGC